jgi:predicted aspartyl protease
MSKVYETITLKNYEDLLDARLGRIKKAEVRQVDIKVLVDTTARAALVISEELSAQLGLRKLKKVNVSVAGGAIQQHYMVSPVELWWHNRMTFISALALPNNHEAVMGFITLGMLDLAVDPISGTVAGAHGDKMMHSLKGKIEFTEPQKSHIVSSQIALSHVANRTVANRKSYIAHQK